MLPGWRQRGLSKDGPVLTEKTVGKNHFDGLIKEATPFAQEAIATRARRRGEDVARRSRKKPSLVVDNTAGITSKK